MSMLADPKTKPSWVLNPRASDWSKDQNKLGQKMLEKMGWSVGKGLGAKEQGRTEALRIAYKADVRGLGAKRKQEQEFALQQQENFQKFLQELNGGDDRKVVVKSLEEKSKTSKARVHYHKFTRGKDISRYSEKDLSCIVGSGFIPIQSIPDPAPKSGEDKSEGAEYCSVGANSQRHLNGNASGQEEADMKLRNGKSSSLQAGKENDNVVKKKKRNLDEQGDPLSGSFSDESGGAALKKKKAKKGDVMEAQVTKGKLQDSKIKGRNKKERMAQDSINTNGTEVITKYNIRKSPRRKPEPEVEVTKKKKANKAEGKDDYEEPDHQNTEDDSKTTKLNKKKQMAQSRINLNEMEIAEDQTNRRSPRRKPEPEVEVAKKKKKKVQNEEQSSEMTKMSKKERTACSRINPSEMEIAGDQTNRRSPRKKPEPEPEVEVAKKKKKKKVKDKEQDGEMTKESKKERTACSRINPSEMKIVTMETDDRSPRRKSKREVEVTKKKKSKKALAKDEEVQNHQDTEDNGETKKQSKKERKKESRIVVSEMEIVVGLTTRRRKPEPVEHLEAQVTKNKKSKAEIEEGNEEHLVTKKEKKKKYADGEGRNRDFTGGDGTAAEDNGLATPLTKRGGRKKKEPVAESVFNSEPGVGDLPSPRKKSKGPSQEVEENGKRKQKKRERKIGTEEKEDAPAISKDSKLIVSKGARNKLEDSCRQNSTESKESKDSEDNDTEQGSTISRASSSFLYELLGKRKSFAMEPVATEDYKKWHILNSSSSDEVDSEEERLNGVR